MRKFLSASSLRSSLRPIFLLILMVYLIERFLLILDCYELSKVYLN